MGGLDDGYVAVDADAGQEKDTAVERGFLDARDQLAEEGAEDPPTGDIDGPEGQREREEQVGQGQVHQIDVCGGLAVSHHPHHIDHHAVAQQADKGYNHIAGCHSTIVQALVCR